MSTVPDGAFLRMQDAIETAIREAGHELADLADVAFVATEAAIQQEPEDDTLRRRLQEVLGHDELPDDDGLIKDVAEWIRIARALGQPTPERSES